MKRTLFILYIVVATLFSGCYEGFNEAERGDKLPARNTTIADLKGLYPNEYHTIEQDIVCEGRVTSSDRDGNFYRSLFIEDESGGLEILLGIYDSYTQYPVGTKVALRLKGCGVAYRNGALQVGLPKNSYDLYLREFESQVVIDQHIIRSSDIAPITPQECKIATLDRTFCGRLIRTTPLRHAPLSEEACENLTGYHRFVDSEGEEIYCAVSEYADFATMAIPEGDTAIVGIVLYESISREVGERFVIYPRSASDLLHGAQDLNE